MENYFEQLRFPLRKRPEFLSALKNQDFAVASDFAFVSVDDVIAIANGVEASTPPVCGLLRVALPALQAALAEM
jgi:hypothetical protein